MQITTNSPTQLLPAPRTGPELAAAALRVMRGDPVLYLVHLPVSRKDTEKADD